MGGFAWVGKFSPVSKVSITAPHRTFQQSSSCVPDIGYTACVNRHGDIAGSADGDAPEGDAPEGHAPDGAGTHLPGWLELALAWLRLWLDAWEDSRELGGRFSGVLVWEGGDHGSPAPTSVWAMYREMAPHLGVRERRWLARECVACVGVLGWKPRLLAGMRAGRVAAWGARGVVNSRRRVARAFVTGRKCGARTCVGLPRGVRVRAARVADPPGEARRSVTNYARPRACPKASCGCVGAWQSTSEAPGRARGSVSMVKRGRGG